MDHMLVAEAETLADMVLNNEEASLDDAKKVASRLKMLISEHKDDSERSAMGIS